MTEEEISLVVGALDSLGVALADHDHQWTEGERAIYEESLLILWNTVEKYRQLSGEVAASGNAPTPANGAFNASSEEYQRIAREAAERIALAEPLILARRATFIFEAIEQAVAAERQKTGVVSLALSRMSEQLAAERKNHTERMNSVQDFYSRQLAAEREAGQELIKMHREAVDKCNEARDQLAAEREEKQRLIEHIDNVAADHKQQLAAAKEQIAPPVDNKFVAEGCAQFGELPAKTEAVFIMNRSLMLEIQQLRDQLAAERELPDKKVTNLNNKQGPIAPR